MSIDKILSDTAGIRGGEVLETLSRVRLYSLGAVGPVSRTHFTMFILK